MGEQGCDGGEQSRDRRSTPLEKTLDSVVRYEVILMAQIDPIS